MNGVFGKFFKATVYEAVLFVLLVGQKPSCTPPFGKEPKVAPFRSQAIPFSLQYAEEE